MVLEWLQDVAMVPAADVMRRGRVHGDVRDRKSSYRCMANMAGSLQGLAQAGTGRRSQLAQGLRAAAAAMMGMQRKVGGEGEREGREGEAGEREWRWLVARGDGLAPLVEGVAHVRHLDRHAFPYRQISEGN